MKRYPAELKLEVCRRYEEGAAMSELSKEYNIKENTIYSWIKYYRQYPEDPFVGTGNLRREAQMFKLLKARLQDLTEENRFLQDIIAFINERQIGAESEEEPMPSSLD